VSYCNSAILSRLLIGYAFAPYVEDFFLQASRRYSTVHNYDENIYIPPLILESFGALQLKKELSSNYYHDYKIYDVVIIIMVVIRSLMT